MSDDTDHTKESLITREEGLRLQLVAAKVEKAESTMTIAQMNMQAAQTEYGRTIAERETLFNTISAKYGLDPKLGDRVDFETLEIKRAPRPDAAPPAEAEMITKDIPARRKRH